MADLLWLLARLLDALFAGSCLYILLVQHPARLRLDPLPAVTEFRETIPRAERLQVPLLAGGVGAGLALLLLDFEARVLLATLLLAAVVPFTVRLVLPINRRLLSGAAAEHAAAAPALLARWGRLHAARTAAALLAALLVLA